MAPARAVLEARVRSGAKDNTLYFGHRASGKDAHYSREWTALAESGHLAYRVAASRDGPEGTRRVYVQDLMRQDAKRVWQLVHEGSAWVYISGCVCALSLSLLEPRRRVRHVDVVDGWMTDRQIRCLLVCGLRWWISLGRKGKWARTTRVLMLREWRGRRGCLKSAGVD